MRYGFSSISSKKSTRFLTAGMNGVPIIEENTVKLPPINLPLKLFVRFTLELFKSKPSLGFIDNTPNAFVEVNACQNCSSAKGSKPFQISTPGIGPKNID